MRYTTIILFCLLGYQAVCQSFFDRADVFFAKYVKEGMVDYAGIRKNSAELDALTREIAELDLSNKRVTAGYLKAFYINSYNLLVIREVVDNYPIEGPLQVKGFFDGIKHVVMKQQMTLDELEKKTLYAQFTDPRLHFVLVCAAKGCPPLANFAYKPDMVEAQIEARAKLVLNLPLFIRVNKTDVQFSEIFKWYQQDFTKENQTVIDFVNQYRSKKLPQLKVISYYKYDWSLNQQ